MGYSLSSSDSSGISNTISDVSGASASTGSGAVGASPSMRAARRAGAATDLGAAIVRVERVNEDFVSATLGVTNAGAIVMRDEAN